jgi:protein phosphatase
VKALAFTDRGAVRKRNEDGVLCGLIYTRPLMEAPEETPLQKDAFMGAVADGMGGGPGGAEAAEAVLKSLSETELPAFWEDLKDALADSLERAARELTRAAEENPDLSEMGAAVAGLYARGDRALAFNCGDCRVYRIRHGYFDLLTKDHSLVYELYSSGVINEEDMATHPLKHMLTSCVQDCSEPPRVFFREARLVEGDRFFICSDGVWEAVPRVEMERVASQGAPEEAALAMARLLKGSSCRDNTSFLWIF